MSGQPVFVLPEGSQRTLGRDAQRMNIAVAYAVAQAIKTTLGPRGMDKMMVSEMGDIVISNDGATILSEMNVEHPAAKMMVEIAKTQDEEVGDGTTTSVVVAGELFKYAAYKALTATKVSTGETACALISREKAAELLEQDVHATVIINGYKTSSKEAVEALQSLSEKVSIKDRKILEEIAAISMGSKGVAMGHANDDLAALVVEAVTKVAEEKDGVFTIDKDFIKIEKKQGGDITQTSIINGVLVDKEVVHPGMPKLVNNAKIALVDTALEIEKTETDARININSPEQMTAFLQQEEKMLKDMVAKVEKSGANVLFCQKGIDDVAQHYLSKAGIMAARRVKKSDMEKMVRATGGRIVTTLDDLSKADLGFAGVVEQRKLGGEQMVFVEQCKVPKAVTLLVRGGSEHVVDEAERAIVDAIGAVSSSITDGKYVYGGGAIEMELSLALKKKATKVGGREQLAMQAYAEALEVIPRTLAESCGLDPIDTIVDLRARHEKGEKTIGVDVLSCKVADMKPLHVIEPEKVKKQALNSASEVVEMILRIDDIIASKGRPQMPGGPGGMGGMGGMGME